ncbi:unnamed protein product, partial [Meganyctiphanes norvegica]
MEEEDRKITSLGTVDIEDMDDFTIFNQDDMSVMGFQVMEEIRRRGKLCDVTLKVAEQCFTAHRIVLAAVIPYFNAMFTHDMAESKQKEITIQGIDAEAMESLINFAYSGKVKIDASNVQSLLEGSTFLQLTKVREACAEFLKHRLYPHNVLGVRTFADTLGCWSLVEACNRYLQKHFQEVSLSDEFLSLGITEVRDIVSRDELNVNSEEQMYNSENKVRKMYSDGLTELLKFRLILHFP